MKKHPVDDLFNRKLSDIERQPSDAAWKRLSQPKKKTENRLVAWVWYAAAGVAVVFMAGYLVWMNGSTHVSPPLAEVRTPTTISLDSEQVPTLAQAEGVIEKSDKHMEKKQEEKAFVVSSVISEKDLDEVEDKVVIADIETTEPKQIELANSLPIVEPVIALNENLPVAMNKEDNQSRTIIVKVDESEESNEDRPKATRFKRILGQLKNAKQGERVDWEEVGFNPKSLVARVDDKLRNGEEKVTEKYQNLKERTKL